MWPRPDALLVDHPSLPLPKVEGRRVRARRVAGRDPAGAGRSVRERAALQLVALTSVLADLDLWPGAGALRHARLVDGPDGPVARVGRFPVPLSRTVERLGGGESAVEALRDACLAAVSNATGVRVDAGAATHALESFFVERHVLALREATRNGLDEATARALWALQLAPLPLPGDDDVAYWAVPTPSAWLRLAASAVVVSRRSGRPAWAWDVGREGDTAPLPAVEARGLLVVCGVLGDPELAAVERWMRRPGCAALALGRFPSGWTAPPPPVFDGDRPERHLAVSGLPAERARFEVESRRGRFDPFADADRRALSAAVGGLMAPARPADAGARSALSWLDLAPDGLPEGVLAVHAGVRPRHLEGLLQAGAVVADDGWWRRSVQSSLAPDPRHELVADVYADGDPRRLRHLALAGGDAEPLTRWARQRLDDLDPSAVRRLLDPVQPDAVETTVQSCWIEACLADLDLAGARRVLAAMPASSTAPWEAWLESLDGGAARVDVADLEVWVEDAPRAAAMVALRALRRTPPEPDDDRLERLLRVLRVAETCVSAAVRSQLEIDRLAILDPDAFEDRALRRRVTGGRAALWFDLLHHRAKRLTDLHRTRRARRLLVRLQHRLPAASAGRRGLLELDLGSVALEDGDSRSAADHHLRASRLLEAAGFRSRLRVVRFNLAVSDLDLLRLESAAGRLRDSGPAERDPHVAAELVRLAVARGDLEEVLRAAERYRQLVPKGDPRTEDGLRWVDGVVALLEGQPRRARALFAEAGEHAVAWWRLCDALVRGSPPAGQPPRFDDWGLERAAHVIATGSTSGDPNGLDLIDPPTALGLAIARRVAPDVRLDPETRRRCARELERIGSAGWADTMRRDAAGDDDAALRPLVHMAEGRVPAAQDPDEVRALLRELDLSGLEVWDGAGARRLWRWGVGEPGEVRIEGRLRFLPLGGTPRDGPVWRLLVAVAELLHRDVAAFPEDGDAADRSLLGSSPAMTRLREELRRWAATAVTVLLRGETGVGKEVAAQALHGLSGRRGRFVPLNIAAVPESLLEAELFGATKGAFTGADRSRPGLAVAADGGTLFLDEIGDLGVGLQVKLLRFLESREVRAVGSATVREVDVRIIAATHRDLEARREAGSFRSDLYYRVAQVPVVVPPLRERLDDLPVLVDRFQDEARVRHGLRPCRWTPRAWEVLRGYAWPGNVRELRHVVEVAMARSDGGVVTPDLLPFGAATETVEPATSWKDAHRDFRHQLIRDTLSRFDGNRSAAARSLGITRQALLYHMRSLGLGRSDGADDEGKKKGAGPKARRRKEEV